VAELAQPQTSSEGVEVRTYGVVQVRPFQEADRRVVTVAVHGVQRVDGGTVVYWSAGLPQDSPGDFSAIGLNEFAAPQVNAPYLSGANLGAVRLVDRSGGNVYSMVPDPESSAGVTDPFTSELESFPEEQPGVMGALFSVLPELPATTQTVDVSLLFGVTFPDVPVTDGFLEPTADPAGVIPLGTGWPEVDADVIGRIDITESVHPLTSVVEAMDNSQVITEQGDAVTVDLAADVLFAFDSADLTPEAGARLQEVADQITAEAAPGALGIVGHTDNQGTDAYNLDLSQRRAQSVAAVLGPAVAGVNLDVAVDGRGEAEPVASNGTPEGQQANRRVTITYTREGAAG
jgi:outer membrane protein OmpA-like peptidoglycan-associated protein